MTLRCTICSDLIFFNEKKENIVAYQYCTCGGRTERLTSGKVAGEHPVFPEKTYYTEEKAAYHYAYINDQGKHFVHQNNKLLSDENAKW